MKTQDLAKITHATNYKLHTLKLLKLHSNYTHYSNFLDVPSTTKYTSPEHSLRYSLSRDTEATEHADPGWSRDWTEHAFSTSAAILMYRSYPMTLPSSPLGPTSSQLALKQYSPYPRRHGGRAGGPRSFRVMDGRVVNAHWKDRKLMASCRTTGL